MSFYFLVRFCSLYICVCSLNRSLVPAPSILEGRKRTIMRIYVSNARAPHEWKDLAHVRQMPIHHLQCIPKLISNCERGGETVQRNRVRIVHSNVVCVELGRQVRSGMNLPSTKVKEFERVSCLKYTHTCVQYM